MKKIKITVTNWFIAILPVIVIVSCQNDFATIGTDIIGDDNFQTNSTTYPVTTYTRPIEAMQTNTLNTDLLGYYSDPVFGSYNASVVSQMIPTSYNPTFGENIVLDSVVLTMPYFIQSSEIDDDGNTSYVLDSIYGDSPIKLSIFQNNYFLRNFNPDAEFGESEKYYSNRTNSQGNPINSMDLEGQLLYTDDEFLPSSEQIILTDIDEDGEPFESAKLPPAIRIYLDNPNDTYWQDLIFNKEGEAELSNENNFLNYFRGIYLKAESLGMNGSLMLLNLANTNSNITLFYTEDSPDEDSDGIPDFADVDTDNDGSSDNGTDADGDGINDVHDVDQTGGEDLNFDGIDDSFDLTISDTFVLNFTGNRVNFFDNNLTVIPEGDPNIGDETLYLKGGEGYMAVINLFEGDDEGNSMSLEEFKSNNWLINEARLEFYVEQDAVQNLQEPDRLFIYDIENERPLVDYFLDPTSGNIDEFSRIDHLHPLEREDDETDGAGIRYKIEITEHIKNIFTRDSINTKLGLYVTSNVNSITPLEFQDEDMVPKVTISGSALSPRGTVLHGNRSADESKRVTLKIFYTEPDN